jgi:hypothetical protein
VIEVFVEGRAEGSATATPIKCFHYVLRDRGCRSPDKDVRDEERAALAAEPPSESTHVLSIYRRNRRRKITWRKLLRGNDLQQKVTLNQQENGGGRLKKVEGNFRKSLIISKINFSRVPWLLLER